MYIYPDLQKDCCELCRRGAECGSIGRSLFGSHIICFHIGPKSGPQIIVQGGIHAREWVTARLVTAQAKTLLREKTPTGIYFLPMTNPDGGAARAEGRGALPERRTAGTHKRRRGLFAVESQCPRGGPQL